LTASSTSSSTDKVVRMHLMLAHHSFVASSARPDDHRHARIRWPSPPAPAVTPSPSDPGATSGTIRLTDRRHHLQLPRRPLTAGQLGAPPFGPAAWILRPARDRD
jgi:hypothetical protein